MAHFQSKSPSQFLVHAALALSTVSLILLGTVTPISTTAASPLPGKAAPVKGIPAQSLSCGQKATRVYFSASFKWKAQPMKVIIAKVPEQRDPVAFISSQTCEATCQIKEVDTASVELACRSTAFAPLTTPATVFIAAHKSGQSTLRFGTWIQGYQQASLRIDLNRAGELGSPPLAKLVLH